MSVRVVGLLLLVGCGGRSGLEPGDLPDAPMAMTPDAAGRGGSGSSPGRVSPAGGVSAAGGAALACPEERSPGVATPLVYYTFDGDARNVGSLGSDYDGVASDVSYVPGKVGSAATVGWPGWVSVPASAKLLQETKALTIAMWIEPDFTTLLGFPFIDCRSFYDGFHSYHGAYEDRRITTCFGTGHPANGPGGCETFEMPPGEWHHLMYVYDARAANVEMYLDGALVATLAAGDKFEIFGSSLNDIWLGHAHEGEFEGGRHHIDEFRIYDVALNAHQQCDLLLGGTFCNGKCILP